MFELEASLQVWKDQLRQRKTLLNEDIEELEQHVRDSIAAHRDRGLTEEESFWVAIGRVGAALIVTSALWAGSWVLTARLVRPHDLGQAALILPDVSVLLAALIPLACLLTMIAIRRRLNGFYKLER
jgi:hypothetical protein